MKLSAFMSGKGGSSGTASRVGIDCVDRSSAFAEGSVVLLSHSERSLASGATSELLLASIGPKSIGDDVGNCR